MSTSGVIPDSELISFARAPAVEEIIDAAARLAADLRHSDEGRLGSPDTLREAVHRVREIKLIELLRNVGRDHSNVESMLFHVAELLSSSNVTVAWQALAGIPAAVTLLEHDVDDCDLPLAWPRVESHAAWFVLMPLLLPDEAAGVWLQDGCNLLGPNEIRSASPSTGLLGFPHGGMVRIERTVVQGLPLVRLTASARERLQSLSCALMTGLLSGALRRMVKEAYTYARSRVSAGKSIDLHQAVALRLADLAIHQQGLALYLQAAIEQPEQLGAINVDHVIECTARIARDAVQVAAAHGYVEGLPFKKLFEQSRTLACGIEMMSNAMAQPTSVAI